VTAGVVLSPRAAAFERIKALVLDALPSPESKRVYRQALDDFFRWFNAADVGGFSKAAVNAYRANLEARKLSSSTINQRLSAIRKLAMEAADNGLMPPTVAAAISRVKGAKRAGVRTGQWLTREQAEDLISAPNAATNKGRRDRALLAVLVGCGLRRGEAAALAVDHIQLREARWVIVDVVGKGGRVRSVPMPSRTKSAIDSWTATAFRRRDWRAAASSSRSPSYVCETRAQGEVRSRADPAEPRARIDHDHGTLFGCQTGSHGRSLRPLGADG